mgnify:CR=1 FL=1
MENHDIPEKRSRHVINIQFYYAYNTQLYKKLLNQKKVKEVNKHKTKAAVYVNAIHAIDAYYLRLISRDCKQCNIPLATIHDGFAVPYTCGT